MSYTVDRKRWAQLSIFEQMGNIGSEVGRSLAAKRRHDHQATEQAMIRALDLFDATVEYYVTQKSPRSREILRAREQYLGELLDEPAKQTIKQPSIEHYFMQFALAARKNH